MPTDHMQIENLISSLRKIYTTEEFTAFKPYLESGKAKHFLVEEDSPEKDLTRLIQLNILIYTLNLRASDMSHNSTIDAYRQKVSSLFFLNFSQLREIYSDPGELEFKSNEDYLVWGQYYLKERVHGDCKSSQEFLQKNVGNNLKNLVQLRIAGRSESDPHQTEDELYAELLSVGQCTLPIDKPSHSKSIDSNVHEETQEKQSVADPVADVEVSSSRRSSPSLPENTLQSKQPMMKFSDIMEKINESMQSKNLDTISVEYNSGTESTPGSHVRLYCDELDQEIMESLFAEFEIKLRSKVGVGIFFHLKEPVGLTADTQLPASILNNMENRLNALMSQRFKNKNDIQRCVAQIKDNEHVHCFLKDYGNGRSEFTLASNNSTNLIEAYLREQKIGFRSFGYSGNDGHPTSHRIVIKPEILKTLKDEQINELSNIINADKRELAEPTRNPGTP